MVEKNDLLGINFILLEFQVVLAILEPLMVHLL